MIDTDITLRWGRGARKLHDPPSGCVIVDQLVSKTQVTRMSSRSTRRDWLRQATILTAAAGAGIGLGAGRAEAARDPAGTMRSPKD